MNLSECCHFVNVLPPKADQFDTANATDEVDLAGYDRVLFIVQKGVGTTGTATIKAQAADAASPLNYSDLTFYYKEITSTDVDPGLLTYKASTGLLFTAGSNHLILIEVRAAQLPATTYQRVRLLFTEGTNDPVLAGVLAILYGGPGNSTDSAVD